jgi:hypothetical protein
MRIIRAVDDEAAAMAQGEVVTITSASARFSRTWPSSLVAVALVVGAAILAGILSAVGDHQLPRSLNAAANSSAPWAMVAFASVYLTGRTRMFAAVLGAVSFVVMDLCFFVAFDLGGGYYPHHYLAFWLGIAILIGPLIGLCASWLRSPEPWLREIAVASPAAILVGEGIFMLVWLPGMSFAYSVASVAVGIVAFAVLAGVLLRRPRRIVVSLAVSVVATGAFVAIYSLLPFVLNKVVP